MIFILILILSHPILVKPNLFPMMVYPNYFTESQCKEMLKEELNKKSVVAAYCQPIDEANIRYK